MYGSNCSTARNEDELGVKLEKLDSKNLVNNFPTAFDVVTTSESSLSIDGRMLDFG